MSPSACVWQRLQAEVIRPGLCTHCGTCAGLSQGARHAAVTERAPLPHSVGMALFSCRSWPMPPAQQGAGLPLRFNRSVFGSEPTTG